MPYQLKNGKWKAQVKKTFGNLQLKKVKSWKTKKEAIAWEAEMRDADLQTWQGKTDTICLIDWAEAYLDDCRERFVGKTYKEKVSTFKTFFKEVDPEMSVYLLTPAITREYLMKQKKERSGYASNKDRKNLLAGWNWGIHFMTPQLPKDNPFSTPKMPEERSPRYIPPEEDFWKVYELTEGQDQLMLLTFLHLACRRGEAFRLKWDDVDFRSKRIRLWTRKREGGTYEYEWLPMTEELLISLAEWREQCPLKSEHVFVCLEDTPFCTEYYGSPFTARQHFMKKLCEKAEVKPFGFHAIRHLTASILYHRGYELSVIQTILRHKSPTTTNRYLKSLGLENVRGALENLSRSNGGKAESENSREYVFGGR